MSSWLLLLRRRNTLADVMRSMLIRGNARGALHSGWLKK